jgi:hypothetical protein
MPQPDSDPARQSAAKIPAIDIARRAEPRAGAEIAAAALMAGPETMARSGAEISRNIGAAS